MIKEKALTVRINEKLLTDFNEITKDKNLNKSALIRGWIEDFVEKNRQQNKGK